MDESSQADEAAVRRIEGYISKMPSLSVTVTRVLEICNSPATSAHDLNRVISLDPVLMGRVLRLINSAYYGLRDKVASLPRAMIMLGMNTVKNLVLSSAVLTAMAGKKQAQGLCMERFWLHCLCTGVTAKWLARAKDAPRERLEDFFVGGLLHDLGKIPLNDLFPNEYQRLLAATARDGLSLHRLEQGTLGVDHAQVGGMIARKWQLGREQEDCLAHHHDPPGAGPEHALVVSVVALANQLAQGFGIGNAGDSAPDAQALRGLCESAGYADLDLEQLRTALVEEVDRARVFLQLKSGEKTGEGAP